MESAERRMKMSPVNLAVAGVIVAMVPIAGGFVTEYAGRQAALRELSVKVEENSAAVKELKEGQTRMWQYVGHKPTPP